MQHGPLITFHLNLPHGNAVVCYSSKDEAAKAQKSLHMSVQINLLPVHRLAQNPGVLEHHSPHLSYLTCALCLSLSLSAGVFWGTLRLWPRLPARRKSTDSLHKGSHWPLPPPAGRPSAPPRAEWISLTPFPAALPNPTSGTAAISTAPPSGAGPTIPVACGGTPVAPRQGGLAALLQSAPSSRWIT